MRRLIKVSTYAAAGGNGAAGSGFCDARGYLWEARRINMAVPMVLACDRVYMTPNSRILNVEWDPRSDFLPEST